MTEFASAPVTLSPSESMLSGKPSFFRRASVTRGTISSMAKDVRSADTIPTIKRQKSQQFAPQALSLLTRRKSMMNMSTRIPNSLYNININPKSFQQQQQRARTMSTADILISSNQCMQQKLGDIKTLKRQQQQQRDAPITKPVNAISATFRLDQDTQKPEIATTLPPSTAPPVYQKVKEDINNNNNNSNYYNLRKCEACNPEGIPLHHPHHHHVQDKQTNNNNNNNNNNNHWNTEEDTNDWSTSTAPDCYSSSSQSQSSFQKKNRKDCRSNEWLTSSAANNNNAGLLFPMTQHMEQQYETLLENLNSSFTAYSNQMQDLSNTFVDGCSSSFSSLSSLSDYNDDDDYESEYTSKTHKYKSQIQECKSLIHQQQDLLDKLEALIEEKEAATLNQKQKQLSPPNNNNNNMNNKNTPTSTTITTTISPTSPSSDSSKKKASNATSDWKAAFSDLFQAKSSGVSEVVVRRNKENEPDKTVIVVSGTGTTTELSLLPKHVNKTKNSVQYVEYKLSLTLNDRKNRFILLPEIKWQVDKKVDQCEFTRKEQAGGARCSVQFGWTWRKHHCRRCGHIYCSTHSANRLPLFQQNASDQPIFSRVCDGCFFDLSTPFLLTS